MQKEVEYVSLSRDTTESDLKQRREIKDGTAEYIHQVHVCAYCVCMHLVVFVLWVCIIVIVCSYVYMYLRMSCTAFCLTLTEPAIVLLKYHALTVHFLP